MPVFAYKAKDLDASLLAGTVAAETPRQARDVLRGRGLTVTHIAPATGRRRLSLTGGRRKAQAEVVSFIRELATLLKAGIPLLESLNTLSRQHRGRFRTCVQQLSDRVAAGVSLAAAMGEQPAYFDGLCRSIVEVGESTGSLEMALKRLAEFREKAQRLRSRATTALIYPAIVCLVGLAVTLFLMTYVVPNLLSTLAQAGRELPAVTQVVKGASDFLVRGWWMLVIGAAILTAAVRAVLRTQRGAMALDRLVLRTPLLGELIRKENTSRIAVVLSALLKSGLQFIDAVRITRGTVRSRVFRTALERYEKAVADGKDIAGPLAATNVFSPMVVQMLSVGQQAGNLEEMLDQVAETYDQEVSIAAARLTAMLEPLLIVLLAILAGFIVFATILPILEMSNVM